MYGTVGRAKIKPGSFDDLMSLMDEWKRNHAPRVEGVVASYTYRLDRDSNEILIVAVFRDKESYDANADDPEQDKWFQRARELMTSDPEWMDGEIY